MKRRAFIQQCAALPVLASNYDSAEARQTNVRPSIRDYCFDGTYADFQLIVGEDLGVYLTELKPFAGSFALRVHKLTLWAKNANLEMPSLDIHSSWNELPVSSRGYLFRILGVTVQTSVVSTDFPTRGHGDYEATGHQIEKLFSEIWQVNLCHQDVWAEKNRPPVCPIEIDPVTGLRVFRN